ncbi:alpha/beta family hydrolase [Colwelliaceae bacterium 6471]
MISTLLNSATQARALLIFAHGAGADMNHPFMANIADKLGQYGIEVLRFNFPYMDKRIKDGKRRPPDRMPALLSCYETIIAELDSELPLFIGGKSMGGRVAASLAKESPGKIGGVVCLGYPFHPSKKPEKLRLEPLQNIDRPVLILQGQRDALGAEIEIADYEISSRCELRYFVDGDHDLKPRVKSGYTHQQHIEGAIQQILRFIDENS